MRFGDMITRKRYYKLQDLGILYVHYPDCTGNYEADEERTDIQGRYDPMSRIDTVGQNGNDGYHYDNPDGVPYESYTDKIERFLADPVDKPKHYMLDGLGVEVIDVIYAVIGSKEASEWLTPYEGGQYTAVIERVLRAPKKNKIEDLKKAHKQLQWLIDSLEDS